MKALISVFFVIGAVLGFGTNGALAQAVAPQGQQVGTWHLEIVRQGWSADRHLTSPMPSVQMGDQDADHPKEYSGDITDATHKIEYENAYDCGPGDAPPQTNPCAFVDYVNLTQMNDHQIHYHIRNHGGRGVIGLHIFQHDAIKVKEDQPEQKWIMGATFIVLVPYDAVDSTVIGKLGHNDVFFTPTNPLTGDDARRFSLIESKKVDGVGTYYSFKVVSSNP